MSRRPISPASCRRSPRTGFAGGNVTIPHKEAAFALRRPARRGGRADRRGQHALARGRQALRRQHRRLRLCRQSRRARAGLGQAPGVRSCSAPAARRAPSSMRCKQRGFADIRIVNRTVDARRGTCRSFRRRRLGASASMPCRSCSATPTCWSTRPRSACTATASLPVDPAMLPAHAHRHRHRLRAAGDAAACRRARGAG